MGFRSSGEPYRVPVAVLLVTMFIPGDRLEALPLR